MGTLSSLPFLFFIFIFYLFPSPDGSMVRDCFRLTDPECPNNLTRGSVFDQDSRGGIESRKVA